MPVNRFINNGYAMSITKPLIETAQKLKSMGVLKATLTREAEPNPGGPGRSAWLSIETDIDSLGGRKVAFTGFFDTYQHHGLLNTTLRLVGDMIENAGLYAATLTNAIEDKRTADHKAEAERKKAAGVLDGKSGNVAFGDVLIEVTIDGAAWMMDPIKRSAGFGFRFDSLDELRRTHPNLRPVSWTNEGIICRPFAMEPGK